MIFLVVLALLVYLLYILLFVVVLALLVCLLYYLLYVLAPVRLTSQEKTVSRFINYFLTILIKGVSQLIFTGHMEYF